MFSGIIEEMGVIESVVSLGGGLRFEIACGFSSELALGESVSVEGVCQTVVEANKKSFVVVASSKTLEITCLKVKRKGDRVNLERAMRLSDRLSGHLVYGHIDALVELTQIEKLNDCWLFRFQLSKEDRKWLVLKGSVAINGVALTVYKIDLGSFEVMIIPHTHVHTTFSKLAVCDKVNVEFDSIGKYVKNFFP